MLLKRSPFSYPLIHNIGGTLKLAFIGTFHREWLEVLYADEPEARKTSITWARILVLFNRRGENSKWIPVINTIRHFRSTKTRRPESKILSRPPSEI